MEEPPREKTRLVATTDEERGTIIDWEFVKLSIRQVLLLILTGGIWYGMAAATTALLSVSTIFSGLLWSWILIGGLYLALWKKDGRPVEYYLTDWLIFQISDRHFRPIDQSGGQSIDDADWEDIDDEPYRW